MMTSSLKHITPYLTSYAGSSLAMSYPDWLMIRLIKLIWGSTGDLPLPHMDTESLDISRFDNAQIEQPKGSFVIGIMDMFLEVSLSIISLAID
jgi:hypothetical protein